MPKEKNIAQGLPFVSIRLVRSVPDFVTNETLLQASAHSPKEALSMLSELVELSKKLEKVNANEPNKAPVKE